MRSTIRRVVAGFILLISLFFSVSISAQELRVFDGLGLSRAQRNVSDSARVVVELSQSLPAAKREDCRLVHSEGLAEDISCVWVSDSRIVFEDVVPGTWRVQVASNDLAISTVTIE